MHPALGVAVILAGVALSLVVGLALRGRVAVSLAVALASTAGAGLAAGALLVQRHASPADWALALAAMAVLWPLHIRVVLGPYGLKDARLLAEDAPGA